MKKHLLMIAAALLLAVNTQARIIEPKDDQVWWGYFNEDDFESGDYTVGLGSPMTLMCGIYIPADDDRLANASIQAVRIYCASSAAKYLSNLKIWISKTLPEKIDKADITQATLGSLSAGINDFTLRNAYQVKNEGFYIGYCVTSSTGYFIRSGGSDAPNAFWIGNPDAGYNWTDVNGQGLGKLAFQILVEGGEFGTNSAIAEDFGENVVLQGEEAFIPIKIKNTGIDPIKSICYTITTEGVGTSKEQEISLNSLAFNATKKVDIPFPADEECRKYQKTFTITQVNGEPNTASAASATGTLLTLKEKQPVTPVIEEFTGTWCQYCPRGIVGMEKIHEAFGDQVVQIAVHNSDPMEILAYNSIVNAYVSGFPTSLIDRTYEVDPSFSELRNALNIVLGRVAPAAIDLSAEWKSAEQKEVVFKTNTRFSFSAEDGQYGIAFLLVEDGLKGTGSGWAQANAYSGGGSGGDMDFWYKAGTSVSGLEYNHVAVAGWNLMNGVTNSVSPTIDVNTPQEFTYSASIVGNTVIQDKTRLKAVALLIDRISGRIINGAQTVIKDFETGISSVGSDDNTPVALYSLDGRKVSTVEKGINIIRMSDGTVKKILIK